MYCNIKIKKNCVQIWTRWALNKNICNSYEYQELLAKVGTKQNTVNSQEYQELCSQLEEVGTKQKYWQFLEILGIVFMADDTIGYSVEIQTFKKCDFTIFKTQVAFHFVSISRFEINFIKWADYLEWADQLKWADYLK